jgi:hypothetical protein
MTKELSRNAESLIAQALHEERIPDPAELGRIRRSLLRAAAAATVTASAAPVAAQTLATKAMWFGVIGKGSFLSAVAVGMSIGAVAYGGGSWVVQHIESTGGHRGPAVSVAAVRGSVGAVARLEPPAFEPEPARVALNVASTPSGLALQPNLPVASRVAPGAASSSRARVSVALGAEPNSTSRAAAASAPRIEPTPAGIRSKEPVLEPASSVGPEAIARFEPVGHASLSEELALLEAAQRAVNRGDVGKALAVLDQLDAHCPSSVLLDERLALEAIAACRAGQRARAERASRRLLQRNPSSPLASRVRLSCGWDEAR